MLVFVVRRLLSAIPTLFAVVALSFFLIRLAPGGPFDLERPLEPRIMANLKKIYGLDEPLYAQFTTYLAALARGDLGPSFSFRDFTVSELLMKGLPVSALIGSLALVVALALGVAAGVGAAVRRDSVADRALMGLAAFGLTVPGFVVAPLLQLVFALMLHWLPVAGWNGGALRNLVLPVLVLALPQIAIIGRLVRAGLIESLESPPIRTLRALGLPSRTVILSALRPALLPVVSYLGPAAAGLMTGSVVVETVFGLPGVGRFFTEGALNRDYTLVMGTVVMVAAFVIVFNLIVDVALAAIDPRVRAS